MLAKVAVVMGAWGWGGGRGYILIIRLKWGEIGSACGAKGSVTVMGST